MTKHLLEILTLKRIEECKILLDNNCYSGAYYLAGYAVECGIKACISKKINQYQIPEKSFVTEFYVHDLKRLVKLAGLESERSIKEKADADFGINWNIVKGWNESARYEEWSEVSANEIYNAIVNTNGGILDGYSDIGR